MKKNSNIRDEWLDACAINWGKAKVTARKNDNNFYDSTWTMEEATACEFAYAMADHLIEPDGQLTNREAASLLNIREGLSQSKVIVFSSEQAQVFMDVDVSPIGFENYCLPFDHVFIHFPGGVSYRDPEVDRIIWWQKTHGEKSDYESPYFKFEAMLISRIKKGDDFYDRLVVFESLWEKRKPDPSPYLAYFPGGHECLLYSEAELRNSFAVNTNPDNYLTPANDLFRLDIKCIQDNARKLANACIGYINCENIYLQKEGEVPAKVNRKREQQGKKILEPYYVCRIRGVQYDSNGEPTGEGTHHGFRYDVRGHFCKLTSGKTTWVRPHQRGLQNELYIPKTYVVEKGAKQPA